MTDILTWVKIAFAGVFGAISFLFGGFDTVAQILVVMMVIDYATGICAAICRKDLCSRTGYMGIMKKAAILCIVACSHLLGKFMGVAEIRSAVIGFYIANESISIVENTSDMGVPMPKKFIYILKKFKDMEDGENDL